MEAALHCTYVCFEGHDVEVDFSLLVGFLERHCRVLVEERLREVLRSRPNCAPRHRSKGHVCFLIREQRKTHDTGGSGGPWGPTPPQDFYFIKIMHLSGNVKEKTEKNFGFRAPLSGLPSGVKTPLAPPDQNPGTALHEQTENEQSTPTSFM